MPAVSRMHGDAKASCGEPPSNSRGERRDKVGFRDYERRDQELRQAHDDAALESKRGQLMVNDVRAVAFRRYQKVWGGHERLKVRASRERRMAMPCDAREVLMKPRATQDVGGLFDRKAHSEVRLAAVKQAERFVSAEDAAHPHIQTGHLASSGGSSGGNKTNAA